MDNDNLMTVFVKDGISGMILEIEVPNDALLVDLLSAIETELNISCGNRVLVNKTQGFEYSKNDTLSSRCTNPNDQLVITYEAEFG